jgi:hypothetical protein
LVLIWLLISLAGRTVFSLIFDPALLWRRSVPNLISDRLSKRRHLSSSNFHTYPSEGYIRSLAEKVSKFFAHFSEFHLDPSRLAMTRAIFVTGRQLADHVGEGTLQDDQNVVGEIIPVISRGKEWRSAPSPVRRESSIVCS